MEDQRVGALFRAARIKHGWRQEDVSAVAKGSRAMVSRIENGHFGQVSLDTLRRVAAALDIRLELQPRWSGGDHDRLVGARHSALHETVARTFQRTWPAWTIVPEVSFSVWGERGVIDFLAWHSEHRALLVGELKTEIVDVNELIGTHDRKRRLAADIGRERGWDPASVSTWLIVSGSRTNRRRVAAHETMLRAAYPAGGLAIRAWLREPSGSIAAMSNWTEPGFMPSKLAPVRRVRGPRRRARSGRDQTSGDRAPTRSIT